MKNDILALVISFVYIFFVIGLSSYVSKKYNVSSELTRKIVHIMVGNWVFITPFYKSLWAIILVPFSFIIINSISLKVKLFKSMEREDNSLGTVFYAISLTFLVFIGFTRNWPLVTYGGILIMAYGDGLAALVGRKYGKNYPFKFSKEKSLEGSLTVFILSTVISFLCLVFLENPLTLLGKILLSLATGIVSSFIEVAGKEGCDNLTLPIGSGLFLGFSAYLGSLSYYIYILITVIILFVAIIKESLTYEGVVGAFLTAITLFALGNSYLGYALLAFFILGSLISKLKTRGKKIVENSSENSIKRSWIQVLSNSLPASLLVWLYLYNPTKDVFLLLAFSIFSAASADTFASEIGRLTDAKVVSILNFKEVPKGLSGGVSLPGTIAGLVGGITLSLFALPTFGFKGFLICAGLGFLGSIIDSYLGILFQRKYKNEEGFLQDKSIYEGQKVDGGFSFVSNNTVNMVTLFIVGIVGYLLLN